MAQRGVQDVKANIEKLYANGAGKEDILAYIQSEGYTPQQLSSGAYQQTLEDVQPYAEDYRVPETGWSGTMLNTVDRGVVGLGRGLMNAWEGAKQLALEGGERAGLVDDGAAEKYTKKAEGERDYYKSTPYAEQRGAKVAEFAGGVLPFLTIPGAQGTLPARIGYGAAVGGATGAAQFVPEDGSRTMNTLIGAGAGGLVGALFKTTTPAERKAGVRTLVQGGKPSQELQSTLDDMGLAFDDLTDQAKAHLSKVRASALTPEQRLRMADFDALGIKPLKGQVTRAFDDMQFEAETAKLAEIGAPLRARMTEQNAQLISKFDDLAQATGGATDDVVSAGAGVKGVIQQEWKRTGQNVSELYKRAREQGVDMVIPDDQFLPRARELMDDFEGVVPQSVVRRISEIADPQAGRQLTLKESDKLRKLLSNLDDGSPAYRAMSGQLKQYLDDAEGVVAEGADSTAQMLRQARAAARDRFQTFTKDKGSRSNVLVDAMKDDAIPDEQVFRKALITGSNRDFEQMRRILQQGDGGQAAWDDFRRASVSFLKDSAAAGRVADEAGNLSLSGPHLKRALEKIGDRKLRMLFSQEELSTLRTLSRVLDSRSPVSGAANYSGTSSAIANLLQRVNNSPIMAPFAGVLNAAKQGSDDLARAQQVGRALNPEAAIQQGMMRATTGRYPAASGVVAPQIYGGLIGEE